MAIKVKNIIQILALFLMLVVCPLGSWYYLQAGFNYQLDARAELKDYGELDFQPMTTIKAETLDKEILEGHISVFNFLNSDEDIQPQLALLKKLNRQFQKEKVLFLTYDLQGNMTKVKDLADQLNLLKDSKIHLMDADKATVNALLQSIKQPDIDKGKDDEGKYSTLAISEGLTTYPFYVLTDTKLQIRNYYDYRDEVQVKRLVEHLAMVMPREKQMKPEIYREKEK